MNIDKVFVQILFREKTLKRKISVFQTKPPIFQKKIHPTKLKLIRSPEKATVFIVVSEKIEIKVYWIQAQRF